VSALRIRDLTASYGKAEVLHGIGFGLDAAAIGVVLGANGAGKTTLLRALSGLLSRVSGEVEFNGQQILGKSSTFILRAGIAHVPQGRGTFPDLTVEENLRIGGLTRSKVEVQEDLERWYLRLPKLAERRRQAAGSLSGGEQQMLAIARAFMARPSLVLLDEPSLGLAPLVTEQLFQTLHEIHQESGIGMLIVEQNADLALEIASVGVVVESGSIVARGAAQELAGSDSIRRAYLGA
jgi:branched-chain amino acid transport system ATP-binding protein